MMVSDDDLNTEAIRRAKFDRAEYLRIFGMEP